METLIQIMSLFVFTILFVCVFAGMVASGCVAVWLMFNSDNKFLQWAPLGWLLSVLLILFTVIVLVG